MIKIKFERDWTRELALKFERTQSRLNKLESDWNKLKAVLQRRKRKCRIKSKVVYEHLLKELADHHNNIESIIKRAASTSSWKLGPQERKIVSVNCLPSVCIVRSVSISYHSLTRTLSSYSLTVARATILGDDQLEAGPTHTTARWIETLSTAIRANCWYCMK